MLAHRRAVLEGIYIAAEAIAWFLVIAVVASLIERSFLEALAQRLQLDLGVGEVADPTAAEAVLAQLEAATASIRSGPPLLVVFAAAAGGFLLMRLVPRLDLGPGLSSAVLVAATLLGVNLLLHLAIGDLRLWDPSGVVRLLDDPASQVASGVDLDAFVADPDIDGPHAGALGVTLLGLTLVWFRFMLAARSRVGMDRMARSFTISFIAVLVALFVGRIGGAAVAGAYAVPQFVLAMLGLAVANHERAVPAADAEDRATPWVTSVGGTLGLLLAAAGVIALLAYLDFGVVLSAAGDVFLVLLEFAVIIIVTPIYWIVSNAIAGVLALLAFVFGTPEELPEILREPLTPADLGLEEGQDGALGAPGWVVDSLKFFAFVGVVYAMYLVGRRILVSRQREPVAVMEQRVRRAGGASFGQLLQDLVSFRRAPDADRWMNARPAYRLFGRALAISRERGLTMLPSETPDEFAHSAIVHLGSPPVADVARLFERARFGRHDPEDAELRNAARALDQWDASNPPTEELRARIRGHRPISEVDSIRLKLSMAKRGLNATDEGILRGE
ncbi:MAG: DUF4129 domain-containing protein [Dehalococcoidia bacterium]